MGEQQGVRSAQQYQSVLERFLKEKFPLYQRILQRWFRGEMVKSEFDQEMLILLRGPLRAIHNENIKTILRVAIDPAYVPPPLAVALRPIIDKYRAQEIERKAKAEALLALLPPVPVVVKTPRFYKKRRNEKRGLEIISPEPSVECFSKTMKYGLEFLRAEAEKRKELTLEIPSLTLVTSITPNVVEIANHRNVTAASPLAIKELPEVAIAAKSVKPPRKPAQPKKKAVKAKSAKATKAAIQRENDKFYGENLRTVLLPKLHIAAIRKMEKEDICKQLEIQGIDPNSNEGALRRWEFIKERENSRKLESRENSTWTPAVQRKQQENQTPSQRFRTFLDHSGSSGVTTTREGHIPKEAKRTKAVRELSAKEIRRRQKVIEGKQTEGKDKSLFQRRKALLDRYKALLEKKMRETRVKHMLLKRRFESMKLVTMGRVGDEDSSEIGTPKVKAIPRRRKENRRPITALTPIKPRKTLQNDVKEGPEFLAYDKAEVESGSSGGSYKDNSLATGYVQGSAPLKEGELAKENSEATSFLSHPLERFTQAAWNEGLSNVETKAGMLAVKAVKLTLKKILSQMVRRRRMVRGQKVKVTPPPPQRTSHFFLPGHSLFGESRNKNGAGEKKITADSPGLTYEERERLRLMEKFLHDPMPKKVIKPLTIYDLLQTRKSPVNNGFAKRNLMARLYLRLSTNRSLKPHHPRKKEKKNLESLVCRY